MFVWLNKQGVRSDEGFEFQFTGRFTAEYRESDRIIDLDIGGRFDRDHFERRAAALEKVLEPLAASPQPRLEKHQSRA